MIRSVLLAAAGTAEGGSGTTLLVVGLVIVGGWLVSLWLHPYTHCRACKGSPRTYGSVFTKAFDLCRTCGGNGRRMRWGARMFARNNDIG